MTEYLHLKNIYKSYQNEKENEKKFVLENIDFTIDRAEFAAVLGPSGCGKTTLLKIAAGFMEAEQGAVYLAGEKISGPSVDRIMVFQEFRQLFPWKTVLDNVVFALQAKDIGNNYAERKRMACSYLKKVELPDVFNYYPYQLSGGMKQRAALARTLAADPEIMLMDEPFGSLDSQTRSNLQNLLIDIWQEAGKTILFVTHDIEEALVLADKIILMESNPGRIKKIINNNLDRPRDRVSTEFVRLYKIIAAV
ncbi:ATP-binding cassette domain-containing protein [Iocasia frigidifontis]|uniref:ATP-binding cassette domain-containing protein n=1 Tax=Iocasia fonsfrigidae TaxID=2682810 RepID=A0A8A7KLH6_9FIRM|nr:ABC transporter ATP-binding protein [Iocasia fonsfrigidae]QTL98944.1 ATP-binding cassette domain-containing protein [Iocasia fonsfrigidae]